MGISTGTSKSARWPSSVRVVFPPGKSGPEISQEIWGFEIFHFSGNLDLGKFFVH